MYQPPGAQNKSQGMFPPPPTAQSNLPSNGPPSRPSLGAGQIPNQASLPRMSINGFGAPSQPPIPPMSGSHAPPVSNFPPRQAGLPPPAGAPSHFGTPQRPPNALPGNGPVSGASGTKGLTGPPPPQSRFGPPLVNQPLQPLVPPSSSSPFQPSNTVSQTGVQQTHPPSVNGQIASLSSGPSSQNMTQNRPNELPVPYHGHGQYSHQVNPLMSKTPTQTPGSSEPASQKSSRGASPVSGSTIDALEGQFAPEQASQGINPPMPFSSSLPPQSSNSPLSHMGNQGQNSTRFGPPQSAPQPLFTPGPPSTGMLPSSLPLGQSTGISRGPPPPTFSGSPSRQPATSQVGRPFLPPPTSSGAYGQMPPSVPNSGVGHSSVPPPSSSFTPVAGMTQPAQPPTSGIGQRPGMPPPPMSAAGGMPPQPSGSRPPFPPTHVQGQMPPFPPSQNQPPMYSPQSQLGQMPPQPGQMPPQPGQMPPQPGQMPPQPGQMPPPPVRPVPPGMGMMPPNNIGGMTQGFNQMTIQDSQRSANLLNEKYLIPPEGIETSKPVFAHDHKKVNCSPDVFRCTLNAIPNTSALLNKARLPLGILIHPFKDLSEEAGGEQLPVIQSSVIVRCRSCRTYINPFVNFIDSRRWKCNLCFRTNELPDEFSFDPVSKTYGDPQRRPEIKSATIEFIAPSEYMLRPPQPAVYLFLLDVSFNAVKTGYLSQFGQILLDELDKLPGDARTSVGFICYDTTLYYFNLASGLSQPQMMCVPDLEDTFLPCPDNLLVNLKECKDLIVDLLEQLPTLFENNIETGCALGAALQAAHKLMSPTGGRVTIMQTCLPSVGPGALQNRETSNSGKNVVNIGPASDFYKKLSLDCSAQQIAVDLFMLNGQFADIATLSCISKYSGGCIYHYPSFHTVRNPSLGEKFDTDLRRYLTRKIGFESVMRIRCTRGLSIHTFHGNFFVRSTDLLSLPNINPDAGFGMQMSIEDNLNESSSVSFQAALLYTSSKGERRIRVHTLSVPVTNQLSEVFVNADQQAIVALLAKMGVDRSVNASLSDARDAMINAALDAIMAYGQQLPASQRAGSLMAPYSLRLMPLFALAMLKSISFGLSSTTRLDSRVFAMQQMKVMPVSSLIQSIYPHLYPLHRLSDENPIKKGKEEIPSAPLLQLTSANIDRSGLFLMDTGEAMYLLVGSAIRDEMCQEIFELPNVRSIPEDMIDLPEVDNPTSERIRSFVNYLMDSRPHGVTFRIIRDDSMNRHLFFQHMVEDRMESSMSYHEFLQFLLDKAKG